MLGKNSILDTEVARLSPLLDKERINSKAQEVSLKAQIVKYNKLDEVTNGLKTDKEKLQGNCYTFSWIGDIKVMRDEIEKINSQLLSEKDTTKGLTQELHNLRDVKQKIMEKEIKKAKVEAERKLKEEADRKAKEEADKKVKEEADRKAKEEADRKAKEEAEKKVKEEEKAKELAKYEEAKKNKWYAAVTDCKSTELSLSSKGIIFYKGEKGLTDPDAIAVALAMRDNKVITNLYLCKHPFPHY
jgi:hypothetical protein